MIKPEWGSKRECPGCGARYYDLSRTPVVCPKCEAPWVESGKGKGAAEVRLVAPSPPKPAKEKAKAVKEVAKVEGGAALEEGGAEVESEDKEEALIEDASELGEDEDDVAVALESSPEESSEER